MPSYVVDVAKKVPAPTRRLMFIRSFNVDADGDTAAIEMVEALDILSSETSVDAVMLFSGDRIRAGSGKMRWADT